MTTSCSVSPVHSTAAYPGKVAASLDPSPTTGGERFLSDLLSTRAATRDGWAWSQAVAGYLRNIVSYDATPWLGRVTAPTLIVWGDDDWIIWSGHAEHFVEHLPHARLEILGGCGHMPEVDCPLALYEALDPFLDAVRGGDRDL